MLIDPSAPVCRRSLAIHSHALAPPLRGPTCALLDFQVSSCVSSTLTSRACDGSTRRYTHAVPHGRRSTQRSAGHVHVHGGHACAAVQEMANDRAHVEGLEARLREGIMARCDHVQLNGPLSYGQRYPGNVNLSFAYVEGESLLMGLREIAVSSGSACTSSSLEPSYVLRCATSCRSLPLQRMHAGWRMPVTRGA